MKYLSHLFAILVTLTASIAGAQINIYKTLGVKDGLVHSSILCIFEDSAGYLWIGTSGGVSRWDGVNWRNFQTQHGLPGSSVRQIIEDETGNIYLATSGGVAIIKGDSVVQSITEENGLVNRSILAIHRSEAGEIYLGTWGGGIYILEDRQLTKTIRSGDGLAHDIVMDIHETEDGTFYFATWGGGISLYKNDKFIRTLNKANGLVNDHVWNISAAADGTLYFGTWGGLSVFKNGLLTEILRGGTDNFDIYDIHQNRGGDIYLATDDGVFQYEDKRLTKPIRKENGLPHDLVRCIFEDHQGILYFGTDDGGISLHKPRSVFSLDAGTGLAGNVILAIYQAPDSTMYFGSRENGVAIHGNGRQVDLLNELNGLKSNRISSISAAENGTIYFGTNGGVSVYRNGAIIKQLDLRNGLQTNRVLCTLVGEDGTLYVGTWSGGLTIFKNEKFHKTLTSRNGLAGDIVSAILEDKDGTFYFAVSGFGVSRYKEGRFLEPLDEESGLVSNSVISIYNREDGSLLFGTWGGGLSIYRDGSFQNIDSEDGLASNIVYAIAEDDDGRIYLNTAHGVNIIDLDDENITVRHFNSDDGLINDSGTRGIMKDLNGRLWFGTSAGVTCYSPDQIRTNRIPPRVHLTGIGVFDDQLARWPFPQRKAFSHDENFFRMSFVGINLPAPEKVIYQHKLSGVDRAWVVGKERAVQYTDLSPDDYEFEVKAMNEFGVWSEPEKLAFAIGPPFWRTIWFRGILVLAILALGWLIYRIRMARILEVEKLRTRIASDLHDDIGATLTHIALGSEIIQTTNDSGRIKRQATKIGALSREVTQTFSDIIWSIDARNDTVGELLGRMKELCYQSLTPHGIEYEFEIDGLDEKKVISVDLRQNIYLIVKEALHNVVKHAGASEVKINLRNNSNHLRISIKDNGQGATQTEGGNGSGIKNMEMRARRIAGSIEISYQPGTEVILTSKSI